MVSAVGVLLLAGPSTRVSLRFAAGREQENENTRKAVSEIRELLMMTSPFVGSEGEVL